MNEEVRNELYETLKYFFIMKYESDQGGQFVMDVLQSLLNLFN